MMPIPTALGAMVIRGCGAVLGRVAGARTFSTIRGASGPIRYDPQAPGTAKPVRGESREDAEVSHSRPLQRLKRTTKTAEEWGYRKTQEQESVGGEGAEEDQSFASAEMQRLKAEMILRDSTIKSSAPISCRRERFHLVAEEEVLSAEMSSPRSNGDALPPSSRTKLLRARLSANSERAPVAKNQSLGEGIFYGDGRKFEGVLPNTADLFDNPFIAAEDKLFETPKTEEDKAIAKEKEAAKNYVLRLLAMAPQPAHKLRQKLTDRNVSASVIESTIVDLQRCGLQSDLEYAEAFARGRWRSSLWGPQRLKQELRRRGVCAEYIEAALETVFSSTDVVHEGENWEEDGGRWGMTKEASEHLWEKAKLQWGRGGSSVSAEARKRRMVGWLQRRGFNWSITSQILKSLESQDRESD